MPPSIAFPREPARFVLPGRAGGIEVATTWPSAPLRAGMGVACHPHPLYGGTMDNKVVTTLERVYAELGLPTLRFNFRGVGKSEGVHDEGRGEGDDLADLVAWMRGALPGHALWLAGFSFGSYVSARMAAQLRPAQLLSIAPPVDKWPFHEFGDPGCPWLVIQGDDDDVAPAEPTARFVANRHPRPTLIRMPATGHFFHGKLGELRRLVHEALAGALPPVLA